MTCLLPVPEGKLVFAPAILIDGELHKFSYALENIKEGFDTKGSKFMCLFRARSRLYHFGISASYWLGYQPIMVNL